MFHNLVREFHDSFNITNLDFPTLPEEKIRFLRKRLITEEFKEYFEADEADDLIEMADALADIDYVACGTSLAYGLAMSSYVFPYQDDADQAVGTGRAAIPDRTLRIEMNELLKYALDLYLFAEASNDLVKLDNALNVIYRVVTVVAVAFKIPLARLFTEVHRSNMTKLDENGKPMYNEFGKVVKSPLFEEPRVGNVIFDGFI